MEISKIAKRHVPKKKGGLSFIYSLNLPLNIAEKVPEGTQFEFTIEDGKFVFTPIEIKKETVVKRITLNL